MSEKLRFFGMEMNTAPGPGGIPTIASILEMYFKGGGTAIIDRRAFTTFGPGAMVSAGDFNFAQNGAYRNYPVGAQIPLGEVIGSDGQGNPIYDPNDKALFSYYEKSGIFSINSYIWGHQAFRIVGTATVLSGGKLHVVGELRPFDGDFDFQINWNLIDIPRLFAYLATIGVFNANPFNTGEVKLRFEGGAGRIIDEVVDQGGYPQGKVNTPTPEPISFSPSDPLSPIYHSPISPPTASAPDRPGSTYPGSRRDRDSGGNERDYGSSGSTNSGGSTSSNSSKSSKGASSSSSGYASTPSRGPTPSSRPSSPQNKDSWGYGNSPGDTARGNGYGGSSASPKSKDTRPPPPEGYRYGPVLLDLSGTGLSIDSLENSSAFFDLKGDGYSHRMASPATGTGMLVLDADADGKISKASEFVFTEWDKTATGDLEAIRNVFDTNGNGKLDSGDARWSEFKVLVDGVLVSLDSLGITSIDLTPVGSGQTFADGSAITGTTTFTRADGSTGTVGDARLVAETTGYIIRETGVTIADGSTRRDIDGYRPDGSLAFKNVVIRNADASNVETLFDDDGNGVFDRSQVKVVQTGADGSRILVVSNYGPEGNLRNRTTTIINADGHSVTTLVDRDGDTFTDERQILEKHPNGSSTTVTEALSLDGTVLHRTVVEASANGLEKISSTDIDGDGFIERLQRETVFNNEVGTRTKTVTLESADGTILSTEVTEISADSRTRSMVTDLDGDGDTDSVKTTAVSVAANGAVTVDSLFANADGSTRGRTTETTSADGYSSVISQDVTGDGVVDLFTSDVTSLGLDGSRVRTTDRRSGDGALLERTITTTSADQKTRTITFDENGDGIQDVVETIIAGSSTSVDTVSVYGRDGTTLISRSMGTISLDGMSRVDEFDINGDAILDYRTVSATVQNADGSATTTVTRWNGTGTVQMGKRVETVSADGLSRSLAIHVGSKSIADSRVNDTTVRSADGSLTRTVTEFQGAAQTFRTVTVTSADRKTQTASTFIGGNARPYQVISKTVAPDGQISETVSLYSPDGHKLVSPDLKTTSGNGLTVTSSRDVNGDGAIDSRTIENTDFAANGDVVKTVAQYRGTGIGLANLVGNLTVATSGNGLEQKANVDADGDGDLDRRINESTTLHSDGSKTQTISQFNGSGAILIDRSIKTVSANGLETSEHVDLDGDGSVDVERIVRSTINLDGSVVKTAELTANGQLRWKQVATTERDGRSGTVLTDLNGDGGYDELLSAAVAMNGDLINTQSLFSPDGTILISRKETTTSADGLRTSVKIDADGNGTFDTWERSSKVVKADGSVTSTNIRTNGDGTVRTGKAVTTVSADGLVETTQLYLDADDLVDVTTIKKRTLNADGTMTEVVDQYSGRNNQKFARTTTVYNPDGRNSSSAIYGETPLAPIQTRSDSFNPDGTRTIVEHTIRTSDPLAYGGEKKTTSISADGLNTVVKIERTGANGSTFGEIVSDVTSLGIDGTIVNTSKHTNLTGVLIEQVVTTTSANGLAVQRVISGKRVAASLSVTTMNDDGSRTRVNTYGQAIVNGAVSNVVSSSTTLTSANGLREETTSRISNTIVRQDVDVRATDGSKSHSTMLFNHTTGALSFAETVTYSADGLATVLRRDSDGLGGIDYEESTIKGTDGRTTVTISRINDDGSIREKVVTVTGTNGLSKSSSFDTDGNGTIDRSWTDVTVLNGDGSRTQTVTHFGADETILIRRATTTTSADGRTRVTETQFGSSSEAGQRQVDTIALDANGNEVVTSITYYADGTKKSGYEITRYRDSDRSVTYFDYNGDGVVDEYLFDIADKGGNRQQNFGYPTGISWRTGASDWSANGYSISESVDGREIRIIVSAPDDPANPGAPQPILGQETIVKSALLDGSYSWTATDANGVVTSVVHHTIDINGIDIIQWSGVRGTSGALYLEVSQRELFLDRMQRIYDTVFDRDMQNSEREQLATYVVGGALDAKQLATNLLNTTEFKTYYGSLSNTAFIDVLYQNTFDRDASLSEIQTWLGKLNSGAISRADLALSLAESAEHYAVGNTHVTTNVTLGQFLHSTDKAIAREAIERLYNVMLDRYPSSAEANARTVALTTGTKSKYQIAAEVLASSTFSALYGSLSNDAFVSQMFQNAFGRRPEAAELQFWSGALSAGTSRADIVVALSSNQSALSTEPGLGQLLLGTATADLLVGMIGNNTIDGAAGNDTLIGLAGADTIIGGAGSDMMIGGAGDDTYVVDVAGDVVVENPDEGIDTIQTTLASFVLGANVENLTYTGSSTFTGTGNAAANVITGGAGNDTLDGKAGDDTLIGGAGNDTYIVDSLGDLVIEAAGGGTDTIKTELSSYSLAAIDNVENLTFTGTGSFTGTGNALDNIITGGAGEDTLSGGAGNDTLIGGAGADTLLGGTGDDIYIIDNIGDVVVENAGEGIDTVQTNLSSYTLGDNVENLTYTGGATAFTGTGNALNNTIIGGAAADRLVGGDGDDTLDGKAGADTMIGGTGDDTYIVDNTGDVIGENADEGIDTIKTSLATYSLASRTNVENLIYTGTAAFNGTGNALDNYLKGGAAADTLSGGDGNDTLDGGAGADTMVGGAGDDTYIVDNASDVVTEAANGGNDTVKTSLASLTLAANVENLVYTGTAAFAGTGNALNNTITGGNGNDTLNGGAGADTLIGGTGDDTYVVDNVGDVVVENVGEGIDTVRTNLSSYTLGDNVENLTFTGSVAFTGTGNALSNTITGGAAADTLSGGEGDDTLDGKAGADTLIGGTGDDTYIVDNLNDVVIENADEGIDTIKTALANYSLAARANVENLVYTGTAAFTGTGNELNNTILGSFLASNILDGGAGADTLWGGLANDTYIIDDVDDVVIEEAGGGTDLIKTTLTNYSLMKFSNVENLTFTGIGDFTGTGNALRNVITGGAGNDMLDGGAGADTMIGGAGNDIYIVDNVADVVTEGANAGTDEIRTSLSTYSLASLANVENLTYTGSGDFTGTGNTGANRITGGAGNDTLNGGAGADTMIGGSGNDTYVVDNAGDIVVENVGEGVDTIRTSLANYSLGENVENLVYTGTGAFTGSGNELDNLIVGGSGSNTLSGGAGNDVLIGGAAADFFVFTPNWGHDTITNFVATGTARDTIRIDSAVFADWASLLAASSQAGTDTIITADVENTITLKNVALSSLQSTNFQFT
jgi:Ca2+-binding RTX toxin-like protein